MCISIGYTPRISVKFNSTQTSNYTDLSVGICLTSGVSPGGNRGRVTPDYRPRRQSCKSPLHFFYNNAIASFISQSLDLSAYACKTHSSTAKLATRMYQNLPFWAQKSEKFLGRGHSHLPRHLPGREGTPPCSHPTPSAPCSLRSPWFVPHFLNRGYAPELAQN